MNNHGCSETEPVDKESKKNKAHLQMIFKAKALYAPLRVNELDDSRGDYHS